MASNIAAADVLAWAESASDEMVDLVVKLIGDTQKSKAARRARISAGLKRSKRGSRAAADNLQATAVAAGEQG